VKSTRVALKCFGSFVEATEERKADLRVESPAVLRRALDGAAAILARYGLLAIQSPT
jgi:hypothetical protein